MVELKERETPHETRAALTALTQPIYVCTRCLYLVKLSIFKYRDKYFIGRGCQCGSKERLSELYSDLSQARIDLNSASWKP